MDGTIMTFVKSCKTCKRAKLHRGPQKFGEISSRDMHTSDPFYNVHVDMIGHYGSDKQYALRSLKKPHDGWKWPYSPNSKDARRRRRWTQCGYVVTQTQQRTSSTYATSSTLASSERGWQTMGSSPNPSQPRTRRQLPFVRECTWSSIIASVDIRAWSRN